MRENKGSTCSIILYYNTLIIMKKGSFMLITFNIKPFACIQLNKFPYGAYVGSITKEL